MPYHIQEHVHRFAAWAASRATSRGIDGFHVKKGKSIIEAAGLRKLIAGPDKLPQPENLNRCHKAWRKKVIKVARNRRLKFTHGVAAKLINTYLKTALVTTAYHNHPRVRALHPPIDRELLRGLAESGRRDANFWRKMQKIGWKKLNNAQYEGVIAAISQLQTATARPLWAIEKYWQGHQD